MFGDNKQLPVEFPEESLLQGINYFHSYYYVLQQKTIVLLQHLVEC